jgi:hypothetical protein
MKLAPRICRRGREEEVWWREIYFSVTFRRRKVVEKEEDDKKSVVDVLVYSEQSTEIKRRVAEVRFYSAYQRANVELHRRGAVSCWFYSESHPINNKKSDRKSSIELLHYSPCRQSPPGS